MVNYKIITGMQPPTTRDLKRTKLDALVSLAKDMSVGDAAILTTSEAQIFRYILTAQGFMCLTDGWRCPDRTKTLAFKLQR